MRGQWQKWADVLIRRKDAGVSSAFHAQDPLTGALCAPGPFSLAHSSSSNTQYEKIAVVWRLRICICWLCRILFLIKGHVVANSQGRRLLLKSDNHFFYASRKAQEASNHNHFYKHRQAVNCD